MNILAKLSACFFYFVLKYNLGFNLPGNELLTCKAKALTQ